MDVIRERKAAEAAKEREKREQEEALARARMEVLQQIKKDGE